jgi:hypothetical protein
MREKFFRIKCAVIVWLIHRMFSIPTGGSISLMIERNPSGTDTAHIQVRPSTESGAICAFLVGQGFDFYANMQVDEVLSGRPKTLF